MIPPYTPALIRKAARSMFSDSAVFSVNVDTPFGQVEVLRNESINPPLPSAAQIMREPTTSHWLKNALETALDRDPVDAIADVEKLLSVLQSRWDLISESYLVK
jgi:hypothetical protein